MSVLFLFLLLIGLSTALTCTTVALIKKLFEMAALAKCKKKGHIYAYSKELAMAYCSRCFKLLNGDH